MTWHDPARRLSDEERALLSDLGYDLRTNVNGGDVARPVYGANWASCGRELEFVEKVGRENAAALDAIGRLNGAAQARALRVRFEAGDFSLELPEEAPARRRS